MGDVLKMKRHDLIPSVKIMATPCPGRQRPRQAAPAARPQAVVLSVPPAGSAACGGLPQCASAGWGLASSRGAEATRVVEKAV